jgi:RNA polymerase sigma-70 factor (ECF subfamily)
VGPVFVLADQHRRRELNDLAGRLDSQPITVDLCEGLGPAPASSGPRLSPDGYRILPAIGELPEDEREVYDLVRIQEMSQAGAAHVLVVSVVTVKRRLNRGLWMLAEQPADLRPGEGPPGSI